MPKKEVRKRILKTLGETGDFFARLEHIEVDFGDGKPRKTYRAIVPDTVHILAFTDEGKIPLVHHDRVLGRGWVYELPGGIISKDSLESPEMTTLRALEEAGYLAHELETLFRYNPIPDVKCTCELIVARKLKKKKSKKDVVEVTPSQFWAMCLDGTITDSQTIIACLVAKDKGLFKVDLSDLKKGHPF